MQRLSLVGAREGVDVTVPQMGYPVCGGQVDPVGDQVLQSGFDRGDHSRVRSRGYDERSLVHRLITEAGVTSPERSWRVISALGLEGPGQEKIDR
jgi:hypothetical protein